MKILNIADLFCGAGGTSTGAARAATRLGYRPVITAINHNPDAINTHKANHPEARHLCTSLDNINPRDLFKPGELDILLASPECTNHSNARGGKPINDQSRSTAFCVTRWAEALVPGHIWIENVAEFRKWGPLDSKGLPLKRREGELFHAWLGLFRACGYRVEYRVVNFADLGDPTTRERLIIQCVRGRRKIIWPNPTHGPADSSDLFGTRRPYRAVRECIDWSLEGKSIFDRKKPLVPKTIRRILAGFERFALDPFLIPSKSGAARVRPVDRPLHTVTTESRGEGLAQAFLIEQRGTKPDQLSNSARSLDEPISTVTTSGAHHSLAAAFVMPHPRTKESPSRSVADPLPTITATSSDFSLASAFVLPNEGIYGGNAPRSVDKPLNTITAGRGAGHLATSFLVQTAHGESEAEAGKGHTRRVRSLDEPMPTVCGQRGDWSKASVLIGQQSAAAPRSVDEPSPTIATGGAIGKVDYIVSMDHQSSKDTSAIRSVDSALSSVTTKARHCLLSVFLVSYYGTNCSSPVSSPAPTITTKDRLAVIRPHLETVACETGTFRRVSFEAWKRLILAQCAKKKRMSRLYLECEDGAIRPIEITHRMLQDYELALAQGFPADYVFHGNKTEKVRQIGNAVPPNGACAIVAAGLTQNSDVSWLWEQPKSPFSCP